MAIKEQATKRITVITKIPASISSNTTTAGSIVDTEGCDNGVEFAIFCTAWTDGAYALLIHDGDSSTLTDAAVVPAAQCVWTDMPSLGAATAAGAQLSRQAVFGTKRYVRASIVSTGTSSGATVGLLAILDKEVCPTAQTA